MRSYIIGDSAYPRSSFMLVGYGHDCRKKAAQGAKKRFNNALRSFRNTSAKEQYIVTSHRNYIAKSRGSVGRFYFC